jgi:PTS system cellobiose-specific IIA component
LRSAEIHFRNQIKRGEIKLDKELEKTIFQIIASSGESKNKLFEAIDAYQKGDTVKKEKNLKESEELVSDANKLLYKLVQREAQGEKIPLSILLVHSLDILMSSITAREIVTRLLETPRKISEDNSLTSKSKNQINMV